MKIFLAATSLSLHYGGPAFSVSRLARALAESGADVGLWAQDGSALTSDLIPATLPPGLTCLSGAASSAIQKFAPDVLHDNGLWFPHNHRLAMIAARKELPRLVSTRGMLEPWARQHKKFKKDLAWFLYQRQDLKNANALHATAQAEAENILRLNLGASVHTIPNGVDVPQVPVIAPPNGSACRTAIFLGRLYPVKGLPLLVQAWNRIRPVGWRLVLAGPDEAGHRLELQKIIDSVGLGDTITFSGSLAGEAKSQALFDADLFILPTHSESFGMAIAEALAHGLPVLTTFGAPWPGLTEKGCGWRTEISVTGLADGLRQATGLDSPTLRAMGAVGRNYVATKFGWDAIARQFLATYASMMK